MSDDEPIAELENADEGEEEGDADREEDEKEEIIESAEQVEGETDENEVDTEEGGPHQEEEEEAVTGGGDIGVSESIISSIPITDSVVLKELKEADEEACKTALIIDSMKKSILNLQKKPHLTEEDAKIMRDKQSMLMQKLEEFEKITTRVQELVGLKPDLADVGGIAERAEEFEAEVDELKEEFAELGEEKIIEKETKPCITVLNRVGEGGVGPGGRPFPPCPITDKTFLMPTRHECLPKVIVCGSEQRVPRVIVCEPVKKLDNPRCYPRGCAELPDFMLTLTGRLSESYLMQEKLAQENASLENQCGQLQQEVLTQDSTVDALQRQIASLQAEMRLVARENMILNDRVEKLNPQNQQAGCPPPTPCSIGDSHDPVASQLIGLENEVKNMQNELMTIQRERLEVQQARSSLRGCFSQVENPPAPPSCVPGQASSPNKVKLIDSETNCPFKRFEGYCPPAPYPCEGSPDELLKLWFRCNHEMKRMQKELEKIEKEREKLKTESPSCSSPGGPPYECAEFRPPCPPPPPPPPPPSKAPCSLYYPGCISGASPCPTHSYGPPPEPGKPCKPNSCGFTAMNFSKYIQKIL